MILKNQMCRNLKSPYAAQNLYKLLEFCSEKSLKYVARNSLVIQCMILMPNNAENFNDSNPYFYVLSLCWYASLFDFQKREKLPFYGQPLLRKNTLDFM